MITPILRKHLYQDITDQLLQLISEGQWKESDRIPGEIELSEQFQVSRNSVREAIKALALLGILHARSGRGTFVAENALSRIDRFRHSTGPEAERSLAEIMMARLVIEPGVVRMASELASEKDFAELQLIIDKCLGAYRTKGYDFELGFAFHDTLFKIVSNRILTEFVEQLRDKLVEVRRDIFFKHVDEKVFLDEQNEHQQILSLMKLGKGDDAAAVMTQHIKKSMENVGIPSTRAR